MTDFIKVYVRVRPVLRDEAAREDAEPCVTVLGEQELEIARGAYERRRYRFDGVFGPGAGQAEVCDAVCAGVAADVLSGVSRTVLTYGQTASGKTHTLFGPPGEPLLSGRGAPEALTAESGLLPRLLLGLFAEAERRRAPCEAALSYVQVYRNEVFDLLRPGPARLGPRGAPAAVPVAGAAAALRLVQGAAPQRAVAATAMNAHSSRSHVLLALRVRAGAGEALLTLADLAGSERVARTRSAGARLAEAGDINASLSSLGKCVRALAAARPHVPFRDCALTRLLRPALAGAARTALVAAVAPARADHDETASTLQFAARCMRVPTRAAAPPRGPAEPEELVYGRFELRDGRGLVRCECPRCGARIAALDADDEAGGGAEVSEAAGDEAEAWDGPGGAEARSLEGSDVRVAEIRVGKRPRAAGPPAREAAALGALRAENARLRRLLGAVLAAARDVDAGGAEPGESSAEAASATPSEAGEPLGSPAAGPREPLPHVLNPELPPPHPLAEGAAGALDVSETRDTGAWGAPEARGSPEMRDEAGVEAEAEPLVVRPRAAAAGYKPIKLLGAGYKPFAMPKQIRLTQDYPQVVYDPASKSISELG